MKVKIMMIALMVSLVPLFSAFPQDKVVEGELSLKPIWVSVDGREGGEAKFTEYRDLREDGGFYGRARLNLDTEKYFLDLKAGDFGYDTQYYKIGGGLWGIFKADLFYNEIPHNITFDARSTFVGAGHDTLIGTPNTNVAGWETFDYSVERRQYGGRLKVDVIRPFFAGLSFQRGLQKVSYGNRKPSTGKNVSLRHDAETIHSDDTRSPQEFRLLSSKTDLEGLIGKK